MARTVMVIATSSIAWKVHLYGIRCNGDRGSGTCADNAARMLISTLASKLINRFGGNFCIALGSLLIIIINSVSQKALTNVNGLACVIDSPFLKCILKPVLVPLFSDSGIDERPSWIIDRSQTDK